MHPFNCRVDCSKDDCSCSPNRHELIEGASKDLLLSAQMALDYFRSRNLDGGQVGAALENAIAKATGSQP